LIGKTIDGAVVACPRFFQTFGAGIPDFETSFKKLQSLPEYSILAQHTITAFEHVLGVQMSNNFPVGHTPPYPLDQTYNWECGPQHHPLPTAYETKCQQDNNERYDTSGPITGASIAQPQQLRTTTSEGPEQLVTQPLRTAIIAWSHKRLLDQRHTAFDLPSHCTDEEDKPVTKLWLKQWMNPANPQRTFNFLNSSETGFTASATSLARYKCGLYKYKADTLMIEAYMLYPRYTYSFTGIVVWVLANSSSWLYSGPKPDAKPYPTNKWMTPIGDTTIEQAIANLNLDSTHFVLSPDASPISDPTYMRFGPATNSIRSVGPGIHPAARPMNSLIHQPAHFKSPYDYDATPTVDQSHSALEKDQCLIEIYMGQLTNTIVLECLTTDQWHELMCKM